MNVNSKISPIPIHHVNLKTGLKNRSHAASSNTALSLFPPSNLLNKQTQAITPTHSRTSFASHRINTIYITPRILGFLRSSSLPIPGRSVARGCNRSLCRICVSLREGMVVFLFAGKKASATVVYIYTQVGRGAHIGDAPMSIVRAAGRESRSLCYILCFLIYRYGT